MFVSNVLFLFQSGYFAQASEEKPLLHTWSLAVEEQYYVLFPLFILLFWRIGRLRLAVLISVVAAVSLALAEWGWRNQPSANFYLAPTRAWELLAGSLCAFYLFGRDPKSSNALAVVGFGLIMFSVFAFSPATPFPSLYAVLPVWARR